MKRRHLLQSAAATLTAGLSACRKAPTVVDGKPVIRFGHFPNITHVQALVAHNLSRQGKGWFESRLGTTIEWYTYNAGPTAIEAIVARSLDVTYIGPSPVLNGFARTKGANPRVLAGAANGGSALLVHPKSGIEKPADFRGKRVATPQLGNTQDVQMRAWLSGHGFKITETGGDVHVLDVKNADQLGLFIKGELDAVWAVEPWATRLELDGGAKVFLEDRQTNVTLLAARAAFIDENHELARGLVAAHRELTDWVIAHPAETKVHVRDELTELTKATPKDEVLDRALARVTVTNEISRTSLDTMVASAKTVGFLTDIPPLDPLLPSL